MTKKQAAEKLRAAALSARGQYPLDLLISAEIWWQVMTSCFEYGEAGYSLTPTEQRMFMLFLAESLL